MLRVHMATKDNKGFFIRPPRQLVNRLDKLAGEFKKSSGNAIAVEVIEQYLDSWVEIETVKLRARDEQQRSFEMLRQRLLEATTEPATKPSAKRKTQ